MTLNLDLALASQEVGSILFLPALILHFNLYYRTTFHCLACAALNGLTSILIVSFLSCLYQLTHDHDLYNCFGIITDIATTTPRSTIILK